MRSSSSAGFDLREAVESLRDAFAPRGASTARGTQGDIRAAILAALSAEPKNGQQVVQSIATGSGGAWTPSASTVFPALQQLVDSGLLSTSFNGERIVYTLTDAGREAAAVMAAAHADSAESKGDSSSTDSSSAGASSGSRNEWRLPRMGDRFSEQWSERWNEHTPAVPKAGAKLAQAAALVSQNGTREQKERAAALLDQTRKALYAILAED